MSTNRRPQTLLGFGWSCTWLALLLGALFVTLTAVSSTWGRGPEDTDMAGDLGAAEVELVAMYQRAGERINQLAGRAFAELAADPSRNASHWRLRRAAQLGQQIQAELDRLQRRTPGVIGRRLAQETQNALGEIETEMRRIGLDPSEIVHTDGVPRVGFGNVNTGAVEQAAADIAARQLELAARELGNAAEQHAARAQQVFRTLSFERADGSGVDIDAAKAVGQGLIQGNTKIAEREIRSLVGDTNAAQGNYRRLGNQIITVGQKNMTVRQYAEMVARTRGREATEASRRERMRASGIVLAGITGSNSKNFCTAFVGLIVSTVETITIDGIEYPAIALLPNGGPPFHPNCSKSTFMYVPGVSSARLGGNHQRQLIEFRSRQRTGRLLADVS